MVRYWIGVACQEHVRKAVLGGFAQVCHGKLRPLSQMKKGDWILYYSPTLRFGEKEPCQVFTAAGEIKSEPYLFPMSCDFMPWRVEVFFKKTKNAPIKNLLDQLSLIKDKKKWGFPFRMGCFEINLQDFEVITRAMEIHEEKSKL